MCNNFRKNYDTLLKVIKGNLRQKCIYVHGEGLVTDLERQRENGQLTVIVPCHIFMVASLYPDSFQW